MTLFINYWINEYDLHLGEGIMKRIKSFICELLVVIIVLSVVFIAGLVDIRNEQSSKNYQDIKKIDVPQEVKKIDIPLEEDKRDIDSMSKKIEEESKELDYAKKQMEALKDSGKIKDWNNSVINYNTKLLNYKKDMKDYSDKLEKYNKNNKLNLASEKKENVYSWIKSILGIE